MICIRKRTIDNCDYYQAVRSYFANDMQAKCMAPFCRAHYQLLTHHVHSAKLLTADIKSTRSSLGRSAANESNHMIHDIVSMDLHIVSAERYSFNTNVMDFLC